MKGQNSNIAMLLLEILQLGGNAFDSLVPAPAHSANWQPMCAITCTFVGVQTMSGYRFRVVLCAYERYIMSLYMYYRVVAKSLHLFHPNT